MRRAGKLEAWRQGAIALGLGCAMVAAAMQISAPMVRAGEQAGPSPVWDADRACAGCHRAIYDRYVTTPMANGSGLARDHFVPGEVRHARSDVEYTIAEAGGTPTLHFRRGGAAAPALNGARPLEYFLGSGNLGSTYLYRQGGYLLESPVAYYSRLKGYDMAPGLTEVTAMPAALPMTRGCMRCHMSDVQAPTPGSRDHFAGLPFLHGGITCEACHGDATAHVQSGGKAAVVNPAKLDAAARDSVCISCHLEGDVSVERKGRSVYEYRPGAHIQDILTHFVFARDSTSRSVSETEELEVSRCKRASGDRMSCMSCHDPHGDPGPAERVAFYRAKCLACHGDAAFVRTHFPQTPDCTGCHMPKGGVLDTPHVAWTDHRIRRRPEMQDGAQAPAKGGGLELHGLDGGSRTAGAAVASDALVPVFAGTVVSERDQALATYKAMERGHPELAGEAWRRLNAAHAADGADATVLMALGSMEAARGEAEQARGRFAEAVRLEPENYEAANDLATLEARRGDWAHARALWERTFALNEDVDALGINLAAAQCALGDRAAAMATLRQVLVFSPDLRRARERLESMAGDEGSCVAAAAR